MSWTRVGAVLPAVLACCAKVSTVEENADAGPPPQPAVTQVEPEPGPVQGTARFTVHFSAAMDEGVLLAKSGRSESVVLAAEADVERAAAAIEHSELSAHERSLLVPAEPEVASDRRSIAVTPDQPLPVGVFYLLISPRLKDEQGRKIAAQGARFKFAVQPPPPRPRLLAPAAGAQAPVNLAVVRAFAESGRVALLGSDGGEVAGADAHGEVALALSAPLKAGARYVLALDGAADETQSFMAAFCQRNSAPSFQGGGAQVSVRDTAVVVAVVLDWPAEIEVRIGGAGDGEPCSGACVTARSQISCDVPACGPPSFACNGSVRIDGLDPASDYALRVVARDDLGFVATAPLQRFTTVAPLPRIMISEVKTSPTEGEYVELYNLGPGAADPGSMALAGPDGVVRPLLATAPPVPLLLAPGSRALAVGASFDASVYPSLPAGTPVLRAATQRLLARGLADDAPPPFRLVLQGDVPVELSDFPGFFSRCVTGASIQRDEDVAPDQEAPWECGRVGGTPGAPP